MLKIIDVSSHNPVSVISNNGSDGCIVKVTQGTWYVNPLCNAQVEATVKSGQLLGLYHYAEGGNPVSEADFFYNNCKNYIDKAVIALDWEKDDNRSWGNSSWCKQFTDRLKDLTGKYPLVYIQASAISQAASCSSTCGLWIAGYPDNRDNWNIPAFNYIMSPWPFYTLWQYSSSNGRLDRNIANLDKSGWNAIAGIPDGNGNSNIEKPVEVPMANKNIERLANEVIWGWYGVGNERKSILGTKYDAVQAVVGYALGSYSADTMNRILSSEIRKGNCGVGNGRKNYLGRYYEGAQKYVNLGK